MEPFDKLVRALRCKRDDCEGCDLAFFDKDEGWMCQYAAKDDDAADAIEDLQKRLVNALTALHLANEKMGYYGIQPYTEADGEDMISDWVKTLVHEELKQELPKRGEWIEANTRPRSAQFYCSVCHRTCYDIQPTRDKAWTKRCRYQFCPNCGADMRKMEVQE